MSLNPEDYANKGLFSSKTQFSRLIFDILKSDNKNNYSIESARIPGMETYKKAGSSSTIGHALGAIVGVGWDSSTTGVISLTNSPIREITIKEEGNFGYVECSFPLVKPISVKKRGWFDAPYYHPGWVKLSKSGLLKKETRGIIVVGNAKKDFPAIESIENDKALIDELFQVGQTPLLVKLKDWNEAFIYFWTDEVKEDKSYAGWIQVILNRTVGFNVVQVTTLLHSIFGIAQHLNDSFSNLQSTTAE
jgi:hypothetical protein